MDFELLVKELIIGILPLSRVAARELESIIKKVVSGYSISKIKETLPSTGDGSTTKYLVEEFIKDKLVQGLSKKTLEQYVGAIQKLYAYSNREVNLLNKDDITNYLNYYRYHNPNGEQKPNTVRNRYLQLSSFYSWMYKNKYIADNPFDMITTPKGTIPTKEVISSGEVEKIIIACEKKQKGVKLARDIAIVSFLLETGVRVSELSDLKIKDIDFEKRKAIIQHGKGDKSRAVYYGDKTKERLNQYLSYRLYSENDYLFTRYTENKKLEKSGIQKVVRNIGEYADIKRIHPHLFRATFATNLINKGISVTVVKELLGHASVRTLESYVNLTESDILHSLEIVR